MPTRRTISRAAGEDLTGALYGGNKVCKLEFLLGDARDRGAVRVITSGAAGSNHALTAVHASRCGFQTTLMLLEQPFVPGIAANPLPVPSSAVDYRRLPEGLHRYFTAC
jgi:hypothetical protein